MTLVRFYVLSDSSVRARERFVCKLANRSLKEGARTYIHVADPADCQRLDELLWTFSDQSFIPHEICGDSPESDCPVTIGCDREPGDDYQVLINLAQEVPHFFSRFEKTMEVIDTHETVKEAGRQRYKFYKDRGYPLESHPV